MNYLPELHAHLVALDTVLTDIHPGANVKLEVTAGMVWTFTLELWGVTVADAHMGDKFEIHERSLKALKKAGSSGRPEVEWVITRLDKVLEDRGVTN